MKTSRVIVAAAPGERAAERIRALISPAYDIVRAASEAECTRILEEQDGFSAILESLSLAMSEGHSVIKKTLGDPVYARLPIIAFTEGVPSDEELAAFERGYADLVDPSVPRELLLVRIRNAVRASDSMSFSEIERVLKELPSCIFLKDAEGKYVFSTQLWSHLKVGGYGWTIRGKTDLEIRKDRQNALKAMEADKRILSTGMGTSYIIEENTGGCREFLELIKRPTHDEHGNVNGIIALINNVTEEQLLKLELEHRTRTDPLTGLLNKTSFEELIGLKLQQSPDTRGALIFADADDFKRVNDTYGHEMGDRVLAALGELIRHSLDGSDIAGRIGGDEFMVFLADADEERVLRYTSLLNEAVHTTFRSEYHVGEFSLSFGAALYPDCGTNFLSLYGSADEALYFVKRHGKNSLKISGRQPLKGGTCL